MPDKTDYEKIVKYLEGKAFRFIKKSNGYIFTTPGHPLDFTGRSVVDVVQKAIKYEETGGMEGVRRRSRCVQARGL